MSLHAAAVVYQKATKEPLFVTIKVLTLAFATAKEQS